MQRWHKVVRRVVAVLGTGVGAVVLSGCLSSVTGTSTGGGNGGVSGVIGGGAVQRHRGGIAVVLHRDVVPYGGRSTDHHSSKSTKGSKGKGSKGSDSSPGSKVSSSPGPDRS